MTKAFEEKILEKNLVKTKKYFYKTRWYPKDTGEESGEEVMILRIARNELRYKCFTRDDDWDIVKKIFFKH